MTMNEKWMRDMEEALDVPYMAPELWPQRAAALRQHLAHAESRSRIALLEMLLSGMGAEELYEVFSVAIAALKKVNQKGEP